MSPRTAAGVTAAVGLVGLAAAFGIAGAQRTVHPLGSNAVRPLTFVAEVPAGKSVCQGGETIPQDTTGVWLRGGTYGDSGPPLRIRVDSPGAPVLQGTLAAGWREGDVVVPVPRVARQRTGARLCVTNGGPAKIALAGEPVGAVADARVGSTPTRGRVRVEYWPAGRESWWARAPELVTSVGRVRAAVPGAFALPLAVLLMLSVAAGAVTLVLRAVRR